MRIIQQILIGAFLFVLGFGIRTITERHHIQPKSDAQLLHEYSQICWDLHDAGFTEINGGINWTGMWWYASKAIKYDIGAGVQTWSAFDTSGEHYRFNWWTVQRGNTNGEYTTVNLTIMVEGRYIGEDCE